MTRVTPPLRGQPQCEACPRSPADRTWVHAIKIELMTQLRHCAGLLSRVLRLGPRRLFARPGCPVVDRDTRGTQPGQQYSSHRGRIESNILGVWWMCFAALQSERQVQLLAKVLNDEIDLIVSHDLLFLFFATQLGSTHENRAVRDWIAPRINPTRLPMGGLQNRPPIGADRK
jgi:hypothetical protein